MRLAPALRTMLLAPILTILVASSASADVSRVLSVALERPAASGDPANLSVDALNADGPVSGMVVRLEGNDVLGLAACRVESAGIAPKPPFAAGSPVRLTVPVGLPPPAGLPAVVRVEAGGCDRRATSVSQPVSLVPPSAGETVVPLLGTPLPLGAVLPVGLASAAGKGKGQARCRGARSRPGRSVRRRRQAKRATLCLLNRARRRSGLRPLRTDRRLSRTAYFHSTRMVKGRFFGHVNRSGAGLSDRLFANRYLRQGLRRYRAGENIAFGRAPYTRPAQIVRSWMASSGHRANILDPLYREIGIGLVPGTPAGARGITYTTDFGYKRR